MDGSLSEVPTRRNWLRMLEAIGVPELASDPRFSDNAVRMANRTELERQLAEHFRRRSSSYWLKVLEERGVPCGPVYDMLQALADPQTAAREMLVEVEHSAVGPVKTLGLPVKFSETPGRVRSGAPIFGEHSRAILGEHGFRDDEIVSLEKDGAIISSRPDKSDQGIG